MANYRKRAGSSQIVKAGSTRDYGTGDIVVYRTSTDDVRRVRVDSRTDNVKHNTPGFDGVVVDGPEKGKDVWGYDDQIITVSRIRIG